MKMNYFVVNADNTYEFIEKETDNVLRDIEFAIGDMARFDSCKYYPGYFVASNECQTDYSNKNKLASCFIDGEVYDTCCIVKAFEHWAVDNSDFDTFTDDDRKEFGLLLNEYIKVVKNENS